MTTTKATATAINFKVSCVQHRGEGENKKSFYYTTGKGVVFGLKGQEMIGFNLLPGVCLSGGLVQIFKDQKVPNNLANKRLDIKVQEAFRDDKVNYHLMGTLFPIAGRAGMYSISLPEGLSLTGGFVAMLPPAKK
ncbi:MAG: hypothetical protein V7749_00765 [Cocleimonas sp.]